MLRDVSEMHRGGNAARLPVEGSASRKTFHATRGLYKAKGEVCYARNLARSQTT